MTLTIISALRRILRFKASLGYTVSSKTRVKNCLRLYPIIPLQNKTQFAII